jgi:hypothetical protein
LNFENKGSTARWKKRIRKKVWWLAFKVKTGLCAVCAGKKRHQGLLANGRIPFFLAGRCSNRFHKGNS